MVGPIANILPGLIAGMTIFLGLPVARLKSASASLRAALALVSAGILLFLIIEVGYKAIEILEMTAKAGDLNLSLLQGLIMVAGLGLGLIGLAALEEKRHQVKSGGAAPLEIATMIAIGIGLHNFAEGLAIGQSYSSGNINLGLVLVLGFALHNATEGFGIAGPLAGSDISWSQLIVLGLIGGAPTAVGSALGGVFVNSNFQLFILCLAVGSLIYVTRELLRLPFAIGVTKAMMAVTAGLILGIATEIFVEAASVNHEQNQSVSNSADIQEGKNNIESKTSNTGSHRYADGKISFSENKVEPSQLTIASGEKLIIINRTDHPLEFESNGLFDREIFVPRHRPLVVKINGSAGPYILSPEGSRLTARVVVTAGQEQPQGLERQYIKDQASNASTIFPGYSIGQVSGIEHILASLTTIDGHVQAAYDLHMQALGNKQDLAKLDLLRAGKHAYHPMHELFENKTPIALSVQSSLSKAGLLNEIKEELKTYSQLAGDKNVGDETFAKAYAGLLFSVEKARKAVAGNLYSEPALRAAAAALVLEAAEDEYKEAVESGKIQVLKVAQPGKDGYLEYQDTRGFLKAANGLLACPGSNPCRLARGKISNLLSGEFSNINPVNPSRPTPAKEMEERFDAIERLLNQITLKQIG